MDKLKNILNPGSKADDQTMYGTPDNTGKIAGEGSHFGQSRHPTGASEGVATGVDSDAASTTAVKDGVTGPFSETTPTGAHSDAVRAAQAASRTPIHSQMTGQQPAHGSHGSPYASHGVDPRVDGSAARNTTVGGGLTSAAAGTAYTADKSNRADHSDVATVPSSAAAPASSISQPTSVTPSAQPSTIGTAVTTGSAPFGSSATSASTAPINTVPDLSNTYGSTATSVPTFSSSNPSTTAASTTATSHATPSSALPLVSGKTTNEPEHHLGRDAALGAGAGAAGLGAYESSRSSGPTGTAGTTSGTSSSGPLGSLRDLIDEKTGSHTVGQSSGSREVDPSTSSGRSALGGPATGSGTSNDIPSGLPLGSLRPLIDEKTGSHAADQTSSSREIDPSTRGTGLGSSSGTGLGSSSGTGLGSSSGTGLGSSSGTGLGSSSNIAPSTSGVHPTTAAGPSITSSSGTGLGSSSNTGLGSSSNTGLGSSSNTGLGSSTTTAGTTSSTSGSGPLGSLRNLIDEKTGSSAATDSSGSRDVGSGSTSDHHYGRDAALGAGAGAAGLGAYEASRHHDTSSARPDTSLASSTTGAHSTTAAGPTSSTSSNYPTSSSGASGLTTGAQPSSNFQSSAPIQPVANETSRSVDPSTSSSHHYGRDAALGAGAGAAGLGAYEAGRHHGSSEPSGNNLTSSTTGAYPSTAAGSTIPAAANTGLSSSTSTSHPTSGSHLGRDAAIGAGAGATAGGLLGSYDYLGGIHSNTGNTTAQQPSLLGATSTSATSTQPLSSSGPSHIGLGSSGTSGRSRDTDHAAAAAWHDNNVKHHGTTSTTTDASKHEQRRRDAEAATAGVVGGAGLAGVAGHEHNRHNKHDNDEYDAEGNKKSGGLLGVFKKSHKDETDVSRDTEHHKDGALGSGLALGGTAAGVGAYEAHKSDAKHAHGATGEPGIRSTGTTDTTGGAAPGHSYGDNRNAGVLGGGLATGSDHHSHGRHKEELHETDADKHEKQGLGSKIKSLFGRNKDDKDDDVVTDKHHHGKEAAVGAGAVGAGAVGAHEYGKHHAGSSNIDPARSDPASDFPQSVAEQKVYRDSFGHLQTDPTTTSHVPSTMAGESGVVRDSVGNYKDVSGTGPTTSTTGEHHRGLEAAGAGAGLAGAGALGTHEYNKRHDGSTTTPVTGSTAATTAAPTSTEHGHHHGHHHGEPDDRHSYAYHPDHTHHRKEETAAAGAGTLGAAGLAREQHDARTTGTTPAGTVDPTAASGSLGTTHGYVNEGYLHQKTEADIAAEKRNSIGGVGILHREGRFHGKEGGAPGAVGVAPEERDESYIESQKHLPILHGKHKGEEAGHHERNRLHKDPPADHPAAKAAAALEAEHAGTTSGGLLHGHHASTLPDNRDLNVENPVHDPAGNGYTGTGAGAGPSVYTGQTHEHGL